MTIPAPLQVHRESVRAEWIDYNGHMNLAYYVLVFDHATDAFLDYLGLDEGFRRQQQCSTFAAELHVSYEQEVGLGEELVIKTRLLGFDRKRIHYFHSMHRQTDDSLVAANELLSLYMDMRTRRVGSMPDQIQAKLASVLAAHEKLGEDRLIGRKINLQGKAQG